jgi:hypothetical protein
MKSKRAKEYIKTIELNKANVDYCLDHGRVSGFLLIDIENAVELAERDAEERHKEAIEEVKKRAVRAHIESCYSVVPSDCDVKLCTECKRTNYFIQKLNEQ